MFRFIACVFLTAAMLEACGGGSSSAPAGNGCPTAGSYSFTITDQRCVGTGCPGFNGSGQVVGGVCPGASLPPTCTVNVSPTQVSMTSGAIEFIDPACGNLDVYLGCGGHAVITQDVMGADCTQAWDGRWH